MSPKNSNSIPEEYLNKILLLAKGNSSNEKDSWFYSKLLKYLALNKIDIDPIDLKNILQSDIINESDLKQEVYQLVFLYNIQAANIKLYYDKILNDLIVYLVTELTLYLAPILPESTPDNIENIVSINFLFSDKYLSIENLSTFEKYLIYLKYSARLRRADIGKAVFISKGQVEARYRFLKQLIKEIKNVPKDNTN